MNIITYAIGGMNLRVISRCEQSLSPEALPLEFVTDGKRDADVLIVPDVPPSSDRRTIFYDDGMIYAWDHGGELALGFKGLGSDDPWPYQALVLPHGQLSATVFVRHEGIERVGSIHPFERPVAEMLLAHFLSCSRGLLVHACGISYNRSGYLFVGPSGVGKSTLARLWRPFPSTLVLSDEKVVIRIRDRSVLLYGTPWGSGRGYRSPAQCPLRAVFVIGHASHNLATPLSAREVIAAIFPETFPQPWNGPQITSSLLSLTELATRVPCYRLGFTPDTDVVEYIRNIS